MSETTAPAAPSSTPGAPQPSAAAPAASLGTGPAPGTPPAAPETVAPAASSSDAAPAAEAPAKPTSVLSGATSEPPAAEVKPPEAPDAKPPEPAPPAAAPVYEAYKLPDGLQASDTQISAFNGILGEFEQKIAADPTQAHAAVQALGQRLVEFHAEQARTAAARWAEETRANWDRTKENWVAEGQKDPEIGGNRFQTTIQRAGAVIEMYGRTAGAERETALRDALGMTGAGDHPALWHFTNWLAQRLTETRARPVPAQIQKPPVPPRSKAAGLYRNTPSVANGAA